MQYPLRRHFLDGEIDSYKKSAKDGLLNLISDLQLEVPPYDAEYEKRVMERKAVRMSTYKKSNMPTEEDAYKLEDLVLE